MEVGTSGKCPQDEVALGRQSQSSKGMKCQAQPCKDGGPPALPMPALGLGKGLLAVPVPKSRAHLDDFGAGERPVHQSPPSVLHSITSVLPFFLGAQLILGIHTRIHIFIILFIYGEGVNGRPAGSVQNLCVDGGDGTHRLEAS